MSNFKKRIQNPDKFLDPKIIRAESPDNSLDCMKSRVEKDPVKWANEVSPK